MKKIESKFKWLAIVIIVILGACTTEEAPVPPLSESIIGTWEPDVYLADPLVGWREFNSMKGPVEMSITREAIIITQFDQYDESNNIVYELEITTFEQDTLRTGSWKSEPWVVFQADHKIYRRDDTQHDNSIWMQCGMHQIILNKMKKN